MKLIDHVKPEYLRLLKKLTKNDMDSISSLPYEKYMSTALWKKIRLWILKRDSECCVVCKKEASEVHHRDYKEQTLIGGTPDMLVSLCISCHDKIENDESGTKRKDLHEKDHRLSELSSIHSVIESTGMTVKISTNEAHGVSNINITYIGALNCLEFYSLSNLAYSFCIHIMRNNRDKLKLPMPFGREKLSQKSGAKILSHNNKKPLATVWASTETILIKQYKNCPVRVAHELRAFIAASKYWRVSGSSKP